jgi:type IV secretory pathway VirB2 component (pilin)
VKRLISSLAAATGSLVAAVPAAARTVALDPAGSGPITGAVDWLRGTMFGNVATAIAVVAVGAVGYSMLTGRINWRHGVTVVLGLFVLFGATSIVAGIRSSAGL